MVQLNASTLPSVKMARGVAPKTERVIQFGEGGFLRAFCDWMIDMANEKAGMDAGVVIVQPIERGMVSMLNEQDGLYTLILRGQVDGKPSKDERIIQSVKRGLSPYEDFEGYLALAHNPDMRIIISNTTEAGIVYTGKDSFDDKPQASYPGKLTRLLYERFTAFSGKKGTGFILLPCELIDYNGRNLEECCLKTAEQWGLSEAFKTWLKEENVFCSTLVDRIVTGYPRGEAETLYEEFGYRDNMLDTAEPFGLWVIEGPAWIEDELPFKKAGCNVVFTQDVSPYKLRKVRMLNGAHTSMVLGAYLAGHEIVGDCMADDTMRAYMSQALFNEIMPTLDLPKDDLEAFASAIFERFSNPFNRHLLLSIALNSQSKFRARVLPTIKEYVKRTGRLPKILTFSMAAFIAFYCGKKKEDGSFVGVRAAGNEYPIADDQFVLDFFAGMTGKPAAEIAHAVLTNADFWGSDLTAELPGFEASVAASLDAIFTKGAAKAYAAAANHHRVGGNENIPHSERMRIGLRLEHGQISGYLLCRQSRRIGLLHVVTVGEFKSKSRPRQQLAPPRGAAGKQQPMPMQFIFQQNHSCPTLFPVVTNVRPLHTNGVRAPPSNR